MSVHYEQEETRQREEESFHSHGFCMLVVSNNNKEQKLEPSDCVTLFLRRRFDGE